MNAGGAATRNDFTSDLNDDTHVDVEVTSVYVQDEVTVSESIKMVLGARYDEFDISVVDVANAGEVRSRTDSEISPRADLIYKPQENVSIYASYSESFLPRSGEQFANINGDKNQLDPDTYSNTELGLKWDISGRLNVSAAIFEIESSSPQVADSDPSTLDVIDSTIEGFEAQVNGQLTDAWGVAVGYSYLDGEQVDRSGATGLPSRAARKHVFSLEHVSGNATNRSGSRVDVPRRQLYQSIEYCDAAKLHPYRRRRLFRCVGNPQRAAEYRQRCRRALFPQRAQYAPSDGG